MKNLILLIASSVLLTGCVGSMVPKTTINGSIAGKPFSLSSPKDSQLTGLEILSNTNGTVVIKIQSLSARVNPEVITTTGDAQAKVITAAMQEAAKAALSGAAAAATGGISK